MLLALTPLASGRADEPAQAFLNQLRAAGYFDMAIAYLDRLDGYPGVSTEMIGAVRLEKAQTYIDAGVAARQLEQRDERFKQAEQQLTEFLKSGSHPRQSQARMQLGRLQMVRAAQLQGGKSDNANQAEVRQSYLDAANTFDTIVESLRSRLKEMQGAKIDPVKDPDQAAQRDQFRGEFLEGIKNAGEARLLAARTFDNPAAEGKQILEQSQQAFAELADKYEGYVQGAIALAFLGEVQRELGMKDKALDSFIRMLEQPDVDALREAKIRATVGMIRIYMSEAPANYQAAIDASEALLASVRPDEKAAPIVQSLRLALAKAYLAKAADKQNQQPAALRRAESAGRQLLIEASKIPGAETAEATELLAGMGVEIPAKPAALPTAADPTSFQDALEKSRQLLGGIEELGRTAELLAQQSGQDEATKAQQTDIENQLQQSRENAILILRIGLGMVTPAADPISVNQARQLLAYLLYQNKSYRGASVVGRFLSQTAAGTEIGLQGGLLALNSLQLLLAEDSENQGLAAQLEDLGSYLMQTWPDDPKAAAAQGTMLKLALKEGRYEEANELIAKLPDGPEKLASLRLMGRIRWSDSIAQRNEGKPDEAPVSVRQAQQALQAGLAGVDGKLAGPEVMKSALALAKIYLQQDQVDQAAATLDDPTYGPKPLVEKLGAPDSSFASDLYSTELQIVVQLMTTAGSDPKGLLDRAAEVMEKLRKSVDGPDAQKRLTGIYVRMAREIRDQLDRADPARRNQLVDAFRLFLERIAANSTEPATLQWTAATLIELAESSINPAALKADGQSAQLLTTAIESLERLKQQAGQPSLAIDYQLGRAQRMLGNYKESIDTLAGLLKQKPMMLDAQIEAARAYQQWAAIVPPKFADKAYQAALNGARPDANQANIIWGWGKISQLTSRDPKHRATFFEARYHVALCRYLWGKAADSQSLIEKSATDIMRVHALYPELGGQQQRDKFDQLLKTIQKQLGQPQTGLPTPT